MSAYETTVIVESPGNIQVAGVPFRPGTRVDVTITPIQNGAGATGRLEGLLSALDKASNSESVGPLRRTELYDRNGVH